MLSNATGPVTPVVPELYNDFLNDANDRTVVSAIW
jgi:hypothetical protein